MIRFFIAIISCFILLVCISQQTSITPNKEDYRKIYAAADKLYRDAELLSGTKGFSDEDEEAMNQKALVEFKRATATMQSTGQKNDSLAFFCYLKTGILEHYFGNIAPAKEAYNKCIETKVALPALADSFLFKPYLYSGSIYYLQDNFDSAFLLYKKAESIINEYAVTVTETERLYNTFGNIYIATGNYKQAKNYFEKAISVLPVTHPYYTALLVNYKINIAATLIQLEEYSKADSIYQSILPFQINNNEILHNIGLINLYTGKYQQAIRYFKKTSYEGSQLIALYNAIARAYLNLDQKDSAAFYFQKAGNANTTFNGQRKNSEYGTTHKFSGDLAVAEKKYADAITNYQQAIIQLDPPFNEINPAKNPEQFSGVFSYIDLFNALTAKGNAYRLLYNTDKKEETLAASLNAYRSAYRLITYVEKTYDSDEARLFLNKTKYTIRTEPIAISLQLYDITKDKSYLEEAYIFDQRNKASILTLNVQENLFKRANENNRDIFARQATIKSIITRLSLKAAQSADSIQAKTINETIRDNEILLSKIQDTINTDPSFARYRSVEEIPSIETIQNKILDNKTALLSYHISSNQLFIFFITQDSFSCQKQMIDSGFYQHVRQFVNSIHNISGETKFTGQENAMQLYETLISPISDKLKDCERLVIIPDDELNYMPFEALQDDKKNYLVNSFAIQYQYSTALLSDATEKKETGDEIFGMAPFANVGYTDTIQKITFNSLRSSSAEIKDLKGKIIIDKEATKTAFLQNANHYRVIHLATHASANDLLPERSFIAFYPDTKDNLLYAQEIYDLKLDSTRLIILSACETGSGQLIRGEGIMSLSRAFAYAGCPNIITSLWKAEDKTTAFLSGQLHYYLNKGYTRDKALQQAKMDLLSSDKIEQRFKTPNYWAHLILIDNYEIEKNNWPAWWVILSASIAIIAGLFSFIKRKAWLN